MSLKQKAITGVYWTAIHTLGSRGLAFIVSIILARLLLPSEFGLIATLAIFISLGQLLITGGLASSLIRTPKLEDKDLSTVFYFNLAGSVLIYVIIYLIAPLVADFYNQEILTSLLRVLGISFIIQAFAIVQNTRLIKLMNFKRLTIIRIPSLVIGALIAIYMAYQGYGVWSLVAQSLAIAVVSTVMLWILSEWKPSLTFDKYAFSKHFGFGYKLTLSGILNTVFEQIYVVLIGKYFPIAQAGFYQRANSLAHYPSTTLATVVHKVSYPVLSEVQDDDQRLQKTYSRILQGIIFLIAPVLVVMAVMASPLFRWMLTEKWMPAVPYFQILVVNALLYPVHAFNLQVLNVKGRSDLFLKAEVIKKILVILIILVVFQYGIYGLLYGSVVGSVLSLLVNTYYSSMVIKYTLVEQLVDLLPAILVAAGTGGIIYCIDQYAMIPGAFNDLVRLITSGVLAVFLYTFFAQVLRLESWNELLNIAKRYVK